MNADHYVCFFLITPAKTKAVEATIKSSTKTNENSGTVGVDDGWVIGISVGVLTGWAGVGEDVVVEVVGEVEACGFWVAWGSCRVTVQLYGTETTPAVSLNSTETVLAPSPSVSIHSLKGE